MIPVRIHKIYSLLGGRTWLVIVADNVEMSILTAVRGIVSPVVYHIVAVIHVASVGAEIHSVDLRMVDTGIAAVVVGKKVMVEGCVATAPDASVAVLILGMLAGKPQGLGHSAPLEGEIPVRIERGDLIYRP